jgi:hypothetical protein
MKQKELIRAQFREAVFRRAGYRCQGPGCAVRATARTAEEILDAHHITDRRLMAAGGYVAENGIALCKAPGGCHEKAEVFHATGEALPGWSPTDLYVIIGSTLTDATAASERLAARR